MDKQKADEILTKYLPKIYGFAIKNAFSYDEAEDICADIVRALYESLLKSEEIYNLDGYIWRISRHAYSKYVSSVKKHQGVSIDGVFLPFEDTYGFEDNKEEIFRLRREIAFLTKTRREIVYAYYYKDKSIACISKEMKIPEGTVKWHLSKARHELKEGIATERKIGKLGMKPVKATCIGHSGDPGLNGGPEYYLNDSLNLNIVYSVYYTPRTKEEIAEELGVTPVFVEDKIDTLETNGFLVRKAGGKFTTYVRFNPETYSLEKWEAATKKQLEIAQLLAGDYADSVRQAIGGIHDVFIPSGNRELLEAAAIFYGVANKCHLETKKDLSPYYIKTTAGGDFIAFVEIPSAQSDPGYTPLLNLPSMRACGNMIRWSDKYPVYSWSIDTRYCSREGGWQNNLTSDYESLYEFITGAIADDRASADKFQRLRQRKFLSDDNKINIMVVKGSAEEFFARIPELDNAVKKTFADYALEYAQALARDYPPQMRDLIISWTAGGFVGNTVALMVMDILYANGTFQALTDREKITSNLILFTDVLPLGTKTENAGKSGSGLTKQEPCPA